MWNPFKRASNAEIDEFSRTLAREIAERFPASEAGTFTGKAARRTELKLGRALDAAYARAREFRVEHGLGVYGRARLGNSFKWELRELGYPDEFVEEATRGLVLGMSRE